MPSLRFRDRNTKVDYRIRNIPLADCIRLLQTNFAKLWTSITVTDMDDTASAAIADFADANYIQITGTDLANVPINAIIHRSHLAEIIQASTFFITLELKTMHEKPQQPLNLAEIKRNTIFTALRLTNGVKCHAAKLLGITESKLYTALRQIKEESTNSNEEN